MRKLLNVQWQIIENFNSTIIHSFLIASVRFIVEECKSKPCLVLILCIVELYLKTPVFLTANVDNDNMYWE